MKGKSMSTVPITAPRTPLASSASTEVSPKVVAANRRLIDGVLIGAGVLAVVVLLIAAGLLTWGNRFAANYVGDELSSQNIKFPSADALTGQGRDDLVSTRISASIPARKPRPTPASSMAICKVSLTGPRTPILAPSNRQPKPT